MEKHAEGWVYSGQASDRLWAKSAIGRPLSGSNLLLTSSEVIFCHEHRHLELPYSEWISDAISDDLNLLDEAAVIEALRVPGNKVVLGTNLNHLDVVCSTSTWAGRWPSDMHPRDGEPIAEVRWFHASNELNVEDLYEWSYEVSSRERIAEVIVVDDESSVVSYRVSTVTPSGEMGELQYSVLEEIRDREFKPLANGGVLILDNEDWPDERVGIPHPNGRIIDSICAEMLYANNENGSMGSSILFDLLSRGLHARPGFKYGTRWRCYDKPLGEEHAPWLVVHPAEAPSDWEGACLASRLAAGVGKAWLHPLPVNDSWQYLSISRPPADSRWANPSRR